MPMPLHELFSIDRRMHRRLDSSSRSRRRRKGILCSRVRLLLVSLYPCDVYISNRRINNARGTTVVNPWHLFPVPLVVDDDRLAYFILTSRSSYVWKQNIFPSSSFFATRERKPSLKIRWAKAMMMESPNEYVEPAATVERVKERGENNGILARELPTK